MDIVIVSIMIIAFLVFLITEKIPIDIAAIGTMVLLSVFGILTPKEAVAGFANPAVITVGAMFLISRAMIRTGAVGFIGEKIIAYSKGNARLAIFLILLIVAAASAFINNTPVVVLFIPIIMSVSCEYNISPSKALIPVSYASILAGTCTLIGTSTNIIVSDLSAMHGYEQLGMFELASLGVPIAVLGLAFLFVAAPWIMPALAAPTCELGDRADRRYLAEYAVPEDSPLIGEDPLSVFHQDYPSFEVFEVARDFRILYPERDRIRLSSGDTLLVKGSPNDLVAVLNKKILDLSHALEAVDFGARTADPMVAELIIPPQSSLLGERLLDTYIHEDPELHIIAVKRRSLLYTEQRIQDMKLRVGDILLVRCPEKKLERLRGEMDFIIVEDVHHEIIQKNKAPLAFAVFLGLIIVVSVGIADIMVCALAAVFVLILGGCIHLRDAYRSLQGNVLLLIAGTIALGAAMDKTGASRLYAEKFLMLFHGLGPSAILCGILLLTSASTQLLSNNATAVLLVPIAISTALALGVSPKPFIIAVCFGASACFATPIGYQTNLLVFGPGGYRFNDYLKLGIPLNLLVLIMGTLFIPLIWPF